MAVNDPLTAFIGLGSNLDDPVDQVRRAFDELALIPGCSGLHCSSLYRSQPMGPQDQPPYINAVAMLTTRLEALVLLDALQAIEHAHHRVREGQRWGPRTLDLDLLLYGEHSIDSERLRVPHPGITEREFVLHPLAEIAPEQVIPGYSTADEKTVRQLAADCALNGMRRLAPDEMS